MVTPVAEGGFQTPASYSTSAPTQRAIAAGDFNGDGTVDLVVSEGFAADVLLGNGDGTFRRAVNYQIGVGASSAITAVVADFNGDGIADLAFGGNSPWVYLLYGNGDGTFRTGPTVSISSEMAGPFVSGMVAGDFNNDGIADLAAANYTENVMIVLLGKGDGTFQPAVSYPAGVQPVSIASGDLNGDGHPDLVVVSNAGNSVITFSGAGDGTFHAFGSYAVGTWPVSVTMADFNRDGRLDIAVANAQGNTVSVLLGNGNGSFQPAVNYAGGTSPASILAADFNGDGKVDLAIATSGAIVLLAGNGDGTFQPLVRYGITWGTQAIALGDFNGDGRVDLAFLASVPGIGGVGIMIGKTPLSGEPMPASRTGVFR